MISLRRPILALAVLFAFAHCGSNRAGDASANDAPSDAPRADVADVSIDSLSPDVRDVAIDACTGSVCGSGCVNIQTDVHHCGGCSTDCTTLGHVTGSTQCVAGACVLTGGCAPGYADCDGLASSGCEADLTMPGHCGSCASTCAEPTPMCTAGTTGDGGTAFHCASGCSGATSTRCSMICVDANGDPNNCGGCGHVCSAPPNAVAICSGAVCGFACNAGYADCDHDPANGCEVATGADTNNCGGCGNICPSVTGGTATCAAGACGVTCATGLCGPTCVSCAASGTGSACLPSGTCGCNVATDCPSGRACDATTHVCATSCSATQQCNGGCCSAAASGTCVAGASSTACGASGICTDCTIGCPTGAACTCSASNACAHSETFSYTGANQSLVVPAGVVQVTVTASGAAGGVCMPATSGLGGSVTATIAVTPGENLVVVVGGAGNCQGSGGFNGGGDASGTWHESAGGGASDVRQGGGALANRVVVAGGGGGGAWGPLGGQGGGTIGGSGANSGPAIGGGGGTQTGGGSGGGGDVSGGTGTLGVGGVGTIAGGGGGGGYYGGGGGGSGTAAFTPFGGGGGGGSSYAAPAATGVTMMQGVRAGNGQVVITW